MSWLKGNSTITIYSCCRLAELFMKKKKKDLQHEGSTPANVEPKHYKYTKMITFMLLPKNMFHNIP